MLQRASVSQPITLAAQPATTPALPPTKAEVERKLSFKLPPGPRPVPVRRPTKSQHSGNESDSSIASSSLPPLNTSLPTFATHLATSPAASPATPHAPSHGPLSAIAERQGSSLDMNDRLPPPPLEPEGVEGDDGEASEEDGAGNAQLERGVDGERVFRSGFLFKKQERRKQWKKKWFVLRSTKLAYYKDNREYSLSRAIDLRQIHSVVPVTSEKQKHPFAFAIVTSDRTFFAEALSAEEREEWVRAINKRMSERQEDETRRRDKGGETHQQHQSHQPQPQQPHQPHQQPPQSRAIAVPSPSGGDQHHHHHNDAESYNLASTWTSTFSTTTGMSVSPAASASGSFFHRAGGVGGVGSSGSVGGAQAPGSYQAPPSSFQPLQPPPPVGGQQGPPQSPSAAVSSQMANVNLGRSPSSATSPSTTGGGGGGGGAAPPSAAQVNRRLSNPIPVPGLQAALARGSSQQRRDPSTGSMDQRTGGASLSPPKGGLGQPPQFVSSDEDEPYFSDPHQAWPTAEQMQEHRQCQATPAVSDPNKIILAMYLMKKSRKTAREVWRKRWFFLTSGGVTYTKSHMDSRPLTFIPMSSILDVFSVDPEDDDEEDASSGDDNKYHAPPARHTSLRSKLDGASSSMQMHRSHPHGANDNHVVRIVTNKRRYDLCAPSEEEEIKWIAAIRALINRERERLAQMGGAGGGSGVGAPPLSPRAESKSPMPPVPTLTQQPPTPAVLPSKGSSPGATPTSPLAAAGSGNDYFEHGSASGQPQAVHGRGRSATQTAKIAVADVVRKFHGDGV